MNIYTTMMFSMTFVLGSCVVDSGTKGYEGGNSCSNSADCQEGFLCLEAGENIKECQEAECITSLDCSFQEYCDTSYSCLDGCLADSDCYSGERCNTTLQQCESAGCTDTEIDCRVGEYCNAPTGTCINDNFAHCAYCTSADYDNDNFDYFYYGNVTDGGFCLPGDSWGGNPSLYYNTKVCSSEADCPRGLVCFLDPFGQGSYSFGLCITDCPFMVDNGYLP